MTPDGAQRGRRGGFLAESNNAEATVTGGYRVKLVTRDRFGDFAAGRKSCRWRFNVARSPVAVALEHWEPGSRRPYHDRRLRVAKFRPHTIR